MAEPLSLPRPALTICEACSYPYRLCEGSCTNPACDANPRVPEQVKEQRRAARAKRQAEEAARQRIRDIRASIYRRTA